METKKETVNINLSGDLVPFSVPKSEEIIYVNARSILLDRLAVLKNKYAGLLNMNQLLTTLAVEAMTDSLKVNERYKLLKTEVNERIEQLHSSLLD